MCQGGSDGVRQFLRGVHAVTGGATKLGEGGEVRIVKAGLSDRPLSSPLFFADLAQLAVVENDVGDVHVVLDRRGQLHGVLAESTVSGHTHDGPAVTHSRPRADGRRESEPDRAQVARHQHVLVAADLEVAAEGVRVVPHVDTQHGVGWHQGGHGVEQRGSAHTDVRSDCSPACFLLAPYGPSLGHFGSLIDPFGSLGQLISQQSRRDPGVPDHRSRDGMEPTQRHRVEVDLDDRLVAGDPCVIEKDAPKATTTSHSFMNHEAIGVPLRPRTPHPSG